MQCRVVRAVYILAAGLETLPGNPGRNSGKLAGKPQVKRDPLEKWAGNLHPALARRVIPVWIYAGGMPSWEAVQPPHILQAVAEYDQLSREEFLAFYSFGGAREYLLITDGKAYDLKAVLGFA
jgi:hypothetical protein